ncbi:MAG: hypothetical protein HY876_00660 [Coriobacteriales bacterium]|nr:hypothetical protein [Coriobacteriales bacterium]
MKDWKAISLVAAGLVAGLVVGSMTIAGAAGSGATTPTPTPKAAAPANCGAGCGNAAAPGACATGAASEACATGARPRFGRNGLGLVDVVAKLTGLSADDVAAARADGKSFADIAKDKGVSADDIVAEAMKARTEFLEARVKDGTLTEDQKDEILAQMKTNLEARVTSTDAQVGRGRMGGGCGGPGRGRGRGAGSTAPTSQTQTL